MLDEIRNFEKVIYYIKSYSLKYYILYNIPKIL